MGSLTKREKLKELGVALLKREKKQENKEG